MNPKVYAFLLLPLHLKWRFLILFLFIYYQSVAQSQNAELFAYNVGFSAFSSGIGAVINKPKSENWRKSFVTGVWQGSIGGVLKYFGKEAIYSVNKRSNSVYILPSKLLFTAGSSVTEAAAFRKPFLRHWFINYGPVRFDFDTKDKRGNKVRFLPMSVYAIIPGFDDATMDVPTTLYSGMFVFKSKKTVLTLPGDTSYVTGLSYGRGLKYVDFPGKYYIISHEIIHGYQFDEYQIFNSILQKSALKVTKNSKSVNLFSKYVYIDLPYITPFYLLEGYDINCYYKNFFEFEAERFATKTNVYRCR